MRPKSRSQSHKKGDYGSLDKADVNIIKPRRGDRITLPNGDVYEVTPPATGLDWFDFSDHKQTLYRIHTKKAKA